MHCGLGPEFQRYDESNKSTLSNNELNRLYAQDIRLTEEMRAPTDEEKINQQSILNVARNLARMYRPTLRKTMRDWHRGTQGYGPSLIIPTGLNEERGPGLSSAALSTILDASNGSPPLPPDSVLFQRGDVVVVLAEHDYASFADDFNPWILLRCNQPHDKKKTQDRCHVNWHVLSLTEDAHTYRQLDVVQYVFFKDLIMTDLGVPFVLHLGTEVTVTQQTQGDLLFELDPDVAEDIMDAIDRLQYDKPEPDSESDQDHDSEVKKADSEALRNKIVQQRDERRVNFIANATLERSRRERPPSRSLRESLLCD